MNRFTTIIARFPGSTCKRCQQEIQVGSRIRYGGRGRTYHLAAECPAGTPAPVKDTTLYGLSSGRYEGLNPLRDDDEIPF